MIGVQAWHIDGRPSGVATRLGALLRGLLEIESRDRVELWASDSVPEETLLQALDLEKGEIPLRNLPIPPGSSLARIRAEHRVLPKQVQESGIELLCMDTLPAPKLPCPLALTLHDLRDLGPYARGIRRLFAGKVLRRAGERAKILFVPSPMIAEQCMTLLPEAKTKLTVLPAPLPRCFDPGQVPREPGQHFLHIGRLEKRKNFPFLLQAYAEARAGEPDFPPLCLVGDIPPKKEGDFRYLLHELQLQESVLLFRGIANEDLRALVSSSIAVLFPSKLEGFGIPVLEALAMGRPPIVLQGGPPAWVAGNHGIVLRENPGIWAAMMQNLAKGTLELSPERMQERAREFDRKELAYLWLEKMLSSVPGG
ncbi:MAG TPA: glycosyltransferase [Planctomycetes bacterium]|nr:glycosyltransferase [Planctomycetota bacterium]